MNISREKNHSAEFLFPLILFLIFAILAIEIVLFAANTYSNVLGKESINNEAETCISYIKEKIQQNDSDGNIDVTDFQGCTAIALKKEIEDKVYTTYIYKYNGEIKELFTQDGAQVTADSGTAILSISGFDAEKLNDSLIHIKCTDETGTEAESYVCIRSGKAE